MTSSSAPYHPEDAATAPVAEVVVHRNGVEILRRLCESGTEAAAVVAHWEEQPDVTCVVVDLSASSSSDSGEVDWAQDDYRVELETDHDHSD